MKKFKSHTHTLFLFAFISLSNFSNVSAQIIESLTLSPGEYEFSIDNPPSTVTNAFWILGDGHFRTGLTPRHHLIGQSNNLVKAFLLESYEINPPSQLNCNTCTSDTTTLPNPNPRVAMLLGENIKIGTSWNPVPGGKHYTILTFESPGITSGSIEINFVNNVTNIDVDPLENNANWIENVNIDNISNTKQLTFNFSNLQQGEQRHVLIQTNLVSVLSGNQLTYFASMKDSSNTQVSEASASTSIRRYPHDPNNKTVDIEKMCSYNLDPTTLEYTITFQNIGANYATMVKIGDDLHPDLDISSVQVISSSDTYQYNIDVQTNNLEFIFDSIFLPGLDQTIPYIPHPNETIGYITFSIETKTCLPPGWIDNKAVITFDNLGSITTSVAETQIDYFEDCIPEKDICFGGGSGDPTDPTDDDPEKDKPGNGDPGNPGQGLQGVPGHSELYESRQAFLGNTEFGIFPNPVSELFTFIFELESEQPETTQLAIYNVQGSMICNLSNEIVKEKGKQQLSINASNWSKGIYFVKLAETNEIHTWKIIKL